MIPLKILPHGTGLDLPGYSTPESAGLDLRAAVETEIVLKPMARYAVPTGISLALPKGYEAEVRPRSGLAFNNGITVLNTPGTVDSDFRGELKVLLINLGEEEFTLNRGFRIAQLVVQRYETIAFRVVDTLSDTERSTGGYGSTGIL
ncbi:MAG: dUTP diphosphatase [Holosporaceae bacterium]|jgi:dUTP pyrophosphatase|nr:dUTP diphosphatase [Holosporaceae bacterium]